MPGAAADVEQLGRRAAGESRFEWHERLAPHGGGGAAKQNLDLMVIAFGGGATQITVALKMELLQVIARVGAGRHFAQNSLLTCAVPPSLDGAQVNKKIDCPTHGLDGAAEAARRLRVIPGLDVAPILLEQGPEIGENAAPVRHRAPAQR